MSSIKGVPAMDVLPEYFPYRDEGCDESPSCLECPLPKCKYDDAGWLLQERRAQRDRQVHKLRRKEGLSVQELARHFGISQRTVHRILHHARNGHLPSRESRGSRTPSGRGSGVSPDPITSSSPSPLRERGNEGVKVNIRSAEGQSPSAGGVS